MPVGALNIQTTQPFRPMQGIKHLTDARKCIDIFLSARVQLSEVNTEPDLPIGFAYQDYWTGIGASGDTDGIQGQHFLEMFVHFLIHRGRNSIVRQLEV